MLAGTWLTKVRSLARKIDTKADIFSMTTFAFSPTVYACYFFWKKMTKIMKEEEEEEENSVVGSTFVRLNFVARY